MEKPNEKMKKFNDAADLEDGIYQNLDATYFVKDGKILMKLKGKAGMFKTTKNFMGAPKRLSALGDTIEEAFEEAYKTVPNW